MADANASKLSLYGGIAANIAIAISKFVAAYFTGSSAMLSEGISTAPPKASAPPTPNTPSAIAKSYISGA
jgi:hypothetical protein